MKLKLNALAPNGVHATYKVDTTLPHYEDWLHNIMSQEYSDKWIFFYTVDSTDIFEGDTKLYDEAMAAYNSYLEFSRPLLMSSEESRRTYKEAIERGVVYVDGSITIEEAVTQRVNLQTFCTGFVGCQAAKHANDCPSWEE
jgi:hypothetical protein